MLQTAHDAIQDAGKTLGLDGATIDKLLAVNAAHEFEIVLKSGKKFSGFRMQHNNDRGPYKGGVRFHPEVDFDEVRALATLMSLKTALVNIPLGGGKGGVQVDPKTLTLEELEELSREYVRHLEPHIGPDKDIPAPDVNTSPQIMDWFVDEYSQLTGDETKGSFTGKSLDNGGSLGRNEATGRGGLYVLEKLLELAETAGQPRTYTVQGFGNAGSIFAQLVSEYFPDWKLIAVSDSGATISKADGLDVEKLVAFKQNKGRFADYDKEEVEHANAEAILAQETSVMVLAALGGAVHDGNQAAVKAEYILELANGPVETAAQAELVKRGVQVVPDFLANAGGVVVSYFEWQQNLAGETWSEADVNEKLKAIMRDAAEDVYDRAVEEGVSLKQAAFLIAVDRLVAAATE